MGSHTAMLPQCVDVWKCPRVDTHTCRQVDASACMLVDNSTGRHVDMKTISVIAQKGGVGKTTIAMNLAIAAQQRGLDTVVIDLDPQASAKEWHDHRDAQMPIVISAQASRLKDALERAEENGAALVVVDTAPHAEQHALMAARASDLVLVPTRCGVMDLRALPNMADTIGMANADGVVVLNAVPPVGRLPDDVAEVVNHSFRLDVCPVRLGQRAAFSHAVSESLGVLEFEPSGKAAAEITALFEWVCGRVDMSTDRQMEGAA